MKLAALFAGLGGVFIHSFVGALELSDYVYCWSSADCKQLLEGPYDDFRQTLNGCICDGGSSISWESWQSLTIELCSKM